MTDHSFCLQISSLILFLFGNDKNLQGLYKESKFKDYKKFGYWVGRVRIWDFEICWKDNFFFLRKNAVLHK